MCLGQPAYRISTPYEKGTDPMDPSVTEPVAKRADQLGVGDLVPDEFLPMRFNKGPAEVVFVAAEIGDEFPRGAPHTFFAFRYPNGQHDSTTVRSDGYVEVFPAADPTGLAYTRADDEPDDPTPVSGGRIEPHTGGMTNRGLVDETAGRLTHIPGCNCQPGSAVVRCRTNGGLVDESDREVHCFTSDPHEPHPTTFAPETGIANGICPGVDPSCQGAPAGFEADCGKPGPHGPHGPEPVSEAAQ
jgi:hypothetical protein